MGEILWSVLVLGWVAIAGGGMMHSIELVLAGFAGVWLAGACIGVASHKSTEGNES